MANKLDPHHLVALMCHVFDKQQDGSSCSLDITSIDPQYGITNKRETTIRTFPILDALASLSVSKADSQVVAISLQVNPGERQIRLMVAENRKVDHSVVSHLKSVWRILQALSTEFEAEGGSDVYEQGSPSIPKGVVLRLRIRLFREIYQHSLAKQMKLEGKWWSLLFDFVKELFIRRGKFLKGVEYGLYQAVTGLDSVLQLARKLRDRQKLTDDEWKMLYHESMFANNKARLVLAEQGDRSCEALAHEFNATPRRPHLAFPLRRALEKLTALTSHVECLISFANSPRLQPTLQYDMHIGTVQGQTRFVQLPTTKEGWVTFLKVAANKKLPSQEDDARGLVGDFNGGNWCPTHCECALIQYLATKHGDSWDNVPAFNYIGVSKLSCGACRVWLEAFNSVGRKKFYTGGSHGKWYWPWAMPKAQESLEEAIAGESSGEVVPRGSLGEIMAGNISRLYIQRLKATGRYRSGSDSTDASYSAGKHEFSDAEMELFDSIHPPEGQESQASMTLRLGL